MRFDGYIGYQHQVNYAFRFIIINNGENSTALSKTDEVRMFDDNLPSIWKMQDKGLERLGIA